jgi:hypothetical protein
LKNLKLSTTFFNGLKNSLISVRVLIEMLDKYEISENEKINLINDSLKKIDFVLSRVNDYLEFIKISSSNKLKISKINLNNLLNNVNSELENYAKEKFINIYLKKSNLDIYLDEFWLKKSIYGILFDAIEYSNGSVNIYTEATFSGVYISISNTGKVTTEKLKDKFKYFESIDVNSKYFCIELALSKFIIDFFGGDVKVESNESLGSEFVIYIPKRPKNIVIKKIILFTSILSIVLFFVISYFPIYPQKYDKISNGGYEIYSFEDGSIVKFPQNSSYKIFSYKNLYNTKYTLYFILNYGEMFLKNVKSNADIKVGSIKLKSLKTYFGIFKDKNTRFAIFNGSVKSSKFIFNKGEGVIVKKHFQRFKLLPAVKDVKFYNSYLSFKYNPNATKYQIIISHNKDFSSIIENFYTTKNHIKLNLRYDTIYFIKIFSFDKNNLPSIPKVVKYINLSHYHHAINLIKNNDLNEAFLELKSSVLTIKNYSSLPYFEIAKLFYLKKEYNKSIKYVSKALKIEPKLNYYLLLFKNYNKINKIKDVESKINYLFKKNPNNLDIMYYESIILYKNKHYKKASKILFRVLQINPYYKGANKLMGEILEKQGYKKMSIYYKNLEKKNGNN